MKICDFCFFWIFSIFFFIGIYYESALKAKNKEIDYELTLLIRELSAYLLFFSLDVQICNSDLKCVNCVCVTKLTSRIFRQIIKRHDWFFILSRLLWSFIRQPAASPS